MLVENWIHEGHIRLLFRLRFIVCTVCLSSSSELFELHNVTGKSTSLVTEDILHLPQLLIEVTSLRSHLNALLFVKHLEVICHHDGLPKLNHFKCD